MSNIEKLKIKFKSNPTSLKFKDIEKILIYLNFEKISIKGSHIKFKHFKLNNDLIIPIHNKDCKEFYKKQISKIISKLP